MIQIRKNVFETNSSSTHSIVVCDDKTWEDFVAGKLFFNVRSRYHEDMLKKYPLKEYPWLPDDAWPNELPIFCTFKEVKGYVYRMREKLSDLLDKKDLDGAEEKMWDLAYFTEDFYSFQELAGRVSEYDDCECAYYDPKTKRARLEYFYG